MIVFQIKTKGHSTTDMAQKIHVIFNYSFLQDQYLLHKNYNNNL